MQENFTLTTAIDEWLAGRPAATRRAYSRDIQELLVILDKDLSRLDETAIQRWLATFNHRRLAVATAQRKLAAVRSFLRFLYQRGILSTDLSQLVPAAIPHDSRSPSMRTTERGRLSAIALRLADPRLQLLLWLVGCGVPLPAISRLRWQDLQPLNGEGVVTCYPEQDRPFRCVIPAAIWRGLNVIREREDPSAFVFQRAESQPATPEELADTIDWALDEESPSLQIQAEPRDRLLTLNEVAQRLGLPETTLRYYRDRFSAYLPSVGQGRSRRYPLQAVERLRWIIEQLRGGASAHEVEAQLRQHPPVTTDQVANGELAQSVDRLSEQIQALTQSPLQVAQILEQAYSYFKSHPVHPLTSAPSRESRGNAPEAEPTPDPVPDGNE